MKLSVADIFDQMMFNGIVKSKDPFRIVITVDGKETTAAMMRGGVIVKKATARCNPDDRFSLKTGAELALSRLFEKKQPEVSEVERMKQIKR